jgi:hypothetical protein
MRLSLAPILGAKNVHFCVPLRPQKTASAMTSFDDLDREMERLKAMSGGGSSLEPVLYFDRERSLGQMVDFQKRGINEYGDIMGHSWNIYI